MTIQLKRLHFFAHHGLYAEEKKIGAEFEIDLSVSFPVDDKITALEETVNYVKLYHLLKDEMKNPRELLETLVMEIAQVIHLTFPTVKKVEISVTKLQAPIIGFVGTVGTSYSKEY